MRVDWSSTDLIIFIVGKGECDNSICSFYRNFENLSGNVTLSYKEICKKFWKIRFLPDLHDQIIVDLN